MQLDPTRTVDLEDPRAVFAAIDAVLFGGDCPYDKSIRRNISFLDELLTSEQLSRLVAAAGD